VTAALPRPRHPTPPWGAPPSYRPSLTPNMLPTIRTLEAPQIDALGHPSGARMRTIVIGLTGNVRTRLGRSKLTRTSLGSRCSVALPNLRVNIIQQQRCRSLKLADVEPEMPAGIIDRAAECWELLLALADAAGGVWPKWAGDAAVDLVKGGRDDSANSGKSTFRPSRVAPQALLALPN